MATKESIQKRFAELEAAANAMRPSRHGVNFVDHQDWQRWSTSAQNLIEIVFGKESVHFQNFKKQYDDFQGYRENLQYTLGVFEAAKADFESGFCNSLEKQISGEVFGSFIFAAKSALEEGNKDVAAVLVCAALEDALKKFAATNGLNVDGKDMTAVINALKSKSLVAGAQKGILDSMPKIRNAAMHAEWSKISPIEVGGIIGYTQQFLIENFS